MDNLAYTPASSTTCILTGFNDRQPSTKTEIHQNSDERQSNKIFRWNILWFIFFCIIFVPLPLWLYPIHCFSGFIAICTVTMWICLVLFMCMVNTSYTMVRLFREKDKDWTNDYPLAQVAQQMVHVVLMAGYKEPLEVMVKTLDTFKSQTMAKRIFAIIAFEERTPDFQMKWDKLKELYSASFLHIMVTRHPYGVTGEIPGKCSNANYATRQAVDVLKSMGLYNLDYCTFTTCDTDNLFPPNYLEYLGYQFLKSKNRHEVIWQPPLMYNYDLDKRPFFVRVTGILRSIFVMGMLIPQNINAMSVYSMSFRLLEKGNFFHPAYQFVDAIDNLVRMIAIRKTVRLIMLPCPVVSGPTSGVNLKQELIEWARQAWRWCIGTAEIFHYFCIKWKRFSFWSGLHYGLVFTHYYGFVICGMALFSVTSLISPNTFNAVGVCKPEKFLISEYLTYIPLAGIGFAYLMFFWCFIIDALSTKLLNIKEEISWFRNFVHWITTPFVLLAYSCVCYFAIVELTFRGKEVCTHGSSKKDGLAGKV